MSTTTTPEDTKKTVTSDEVVNPDADVKAGKPERAKPVHLPFRHGDDQFYTELARISGTMFIGLLAVMTFLLTIGYSRPHATFAWSLYASIVSLTLSLVLYVIGRFFRMQADNQHWSLKHIEDDDKSLKAQQKKFKNALRELKITRILQQLVFVVSVLAMSSLALATAHFFFALAAAAASQSTPVQ